VHAFVSVYVFDIKIVWIHNVLHWQSIGISMLFGAAAVFMLHVSFGHFFAKFLFDLFNDVYFDIMW